MNKAQLIEAIAETTGQTKTAASDFLDAFTSNVSKALKKGDDVTLVGFGTFSVRKRAARAGRNPQTGEELKIKASKAPVFKAGKSLKDAVQ